VFASDDALVMTHSLSTTMADVAGACCALSVGWLHYEDPDRGPAFRGEMSAVKFEVPPQVSGRTVTRATLRLTVQSVRGDLQITPQIRVNAFSGDWNRATITWNIWAGLGTQTLGEASAAVPNSNELPFDLDVTTIVRNWVSGAWPNYGLKLSVDPYPATGYRSAAGTGFFSLRNANTPDQRPKLIIDYQ
jgi:hypothetical protein